MNKGENVRKELRFDLADIASDVGPTRRSITQSRAKGDSSRFRYPKSVYRGLAVRRRLKEEERALSALWEILTFLAFLVVAVVASTGHFYTRHFLTFRAVQDMFVSNHHSNNVFPLKVVRRYEDVWEYLRQTYLPAMFGNSATSTAFKDIVLVGQPRLRQTRCSFVTDLSEKTHGMLGRSRSPSPSCFISQEETRHYNGSWQTPLEGRTQHPSTPSPFSQRPFCSPRAKQNDTLRELPTHVMTASEASPWMHQSAERLESHVTWGYRAWYSGAGYVSEIPRDQALAQQMLDNLQRAEWLDRNSSSLTVEATLVNANYDFLIQLQILFEFDSLRVVVASPSVMVNKISWKTSKFQSCIRSAELLFCIFILAYMWQTARTVFRLGVKRCFRDRWFLLRLVISWVGVTIIALRAVEAAEEKQFLTRAKAEGKCRYLAVSTVMTVAMVRQVFVAVLLMLAVLNCFKILRINHHFVIFLKTFEAARKSLSHLCIATSLLFAAFVSFAVLAFDTRHRDYRNVPSGICSLFLVSIGIYTQRPGEVVPVPPLFLVFVAALAFVMMMTILWFCTIIMEAFICTRLLVQLQFSRNDVLHYMHRKLALALGMRTRRVRQMFMTERRVRNRGRVIVRM